MHSVKEIYYGLSCEMYVYNNFAILQTQINSWLSLSLPGIIFLKKLIVLYIGCSMK